MTGGPTSCKDLDTVQYLVASRDTGVAELKLNLSGNAGYEYTLSLPPGKYPLNVTYEPTKQHCSFIVHVYCKLC